MLLIAGIFYVGMQVHGGVKSEQAQKFKKLQKEMQGSLQAESSTLGVDSDDSSATSDDDLDAFQASSPVFEKALAVALLPLFPVVEEELANRLKSLAFPDTSNNKTTANAEVLETAHEEPSAKHRRTDPA